jgi:hypothetical protein
MKKFVVLFFYFCCCAISFAQTSEEIVVQQFGNYLSRWCSSNDTDYRMRAQKQCTDACRVNDKIMEDFVAKSGLSIKDYVIPNYLNAFENALDRGKLVVNMYGVEMIPKNEWESVSPYGHNQERKIVKEIIIVSGGITVKGSLNYNIKDLFYLHKGKIVKITPYEEIIDKKTGKVKVKVDFSDLNSLFWVKDRHYDAVGISLGYSKNYPLNIGFYRNISYLNIGIEAGGAFGSTVVGESEYKGAKTDVYDKGFYVLATPGVFLGHVTFNCGFGVVALRQKYINSDVSTGANKFYGMLKPSVEFNIPLSIGKDKYHSFDFMLCPRVAYNYTMKVNSMNCWEIGLCFRYYYGG